MISFIQIDGSEKHLEVLDQIFKSLAPEIYRHLGSPTAEAEWNALPKGMARQDKSYYLISKDDLPLGCVEVLRGYPNSHTAYIGLMAIHAMFQGQGIGTLAWESVEASIKAWDEIRMIRLGVSETHESAVQFWQKMGFVNTGIMQTATNVQPPVICQIFEKKI